MSLQPLMRRKLRSASSSTAPTQRRTILVSFHRFTRVVVRTIEIIDSMLLVHDSERASRSLMPRRRTVNRSQERFEQIKAEFRSFAMKLDVHDLTFIPISVLHGDNVVDRSADMAWYEGSSLLHHLGEAHIASDRNLIDVRFPVQYVIRPQDQTNHHLHDYRGYAGSVAGGVLKPGDEVVVLPSGHTTTIAASDTPDGPVHEAFAPMAVTVRLTDDIDVSRGDMICRARNRPHVGQDLEAMVCWLTQDSDLRPAAKLAIKHTSRWGRALVKDLQYRLDVNTLHRDEHATSLAVNEIGRVHLRATVPLFYDEYRRNRTTGSFILVDEATNNTAGAGIILGPVEE
jgi:bifunctional enzyme CysN/CysC